MYTDVTLYLQSYVVLSEYTKAASSFKAKDYCNRNDKTRFTNKNTEA